jgi:TonB family protein
LALSFGVRSPKSIYVPRELEIDLFHPNHAPLGTPAPLDPAFIGLQEVLVPEPTFTIETDREMANGIAAVGVTQSLPPRLDPKHVNPRLQLPHTLGDLVGALSLELRVLVLADGSIGNAQIQRSTGQGDIDRLAIETVKSSWHFLPASLNSQPTEAWINVVVRFAPF